jgi:hypothetical protein
MFETIEQPVINFLIYLSILLIGVIAFFLRNIYVEHKETLRTAKEAQRRLAELMLHYQDLKNQVQEQSKLQVEIIKVENESKRYWETLKTVVEKQHELLLEKVENTNQYIKLLLENQVKTQL